MPTPKRKAADLGFDDIPDVSNTQHPVKGAGVDAFFAPKSDASLERVSTRAQEATSTKGNNPRLKFKKLSARLDDEAWDGLDAMTRGIESSFRKYKFTQEEAVEEIIKFAYQQWLASPDDNFLLDRFAEKAYEAKST